MENVDVKNFEGALVGLAVGDALGMQVEGCHAYEFIRDYGDARFDSVNRSLKAGQYTDDTLQMLILTRSIISAGGFDLNAFVSGLKAWGVEIKEDMRRSRGIGPTSIEAIRKLLGGVSSSESGGSSPTCGSSMRVAPIGLLYGHDLDLTAEIAAKSSIPTHRSDEAIAGAVAVAVAVGGVTSWLGIANAISKARYYAEAHSKKLADKIELAISLKDDDARDALEVIGTSIAASESVPAALFAALHGESFEDTLLIAVNHGGDTDSIGAMAHRA
jgi:ADP-ribosylglycohydrolase